MEDDKHNKTDKEQEVQEDKKQEEEEKEEDFVDEEDDADIGEFLSEDQLQAMGVDLAQLNADQTDAQSWVTDATDKGNDDMDDLGEDLDPNNLNVNDADVIGEVYEEGPANQSTQSTISYSDKVIRTYKEHSDAVLCFEILNGFIFSGGMDDRIVKWSLDSDKAIDSKKFNETVSFMTKREESDLLAAGFLDDTIVVIKGDSFETIQTIKTEFEEICSLCFHTKSDSLLAGFKNGSIHMWNATSGKEMACLEGHYDEITDAQFSVDTKQVVSISLDESLRVWSPRDCYEKLNISGNKFHSAGILCLTLLDDNKTALTGGGDSVVILSSIETGKIFSKSIEFNADICSVDLSEAWKSVFITTYSGKMYTLDKSNFKILHEEEHKGGIVKTRFENSCKCYLISTADGCIVFHSYGKTGVINRLKIHSSEIHHFEVVKGHLITSSEDKTLAMTEIPKLN